MRLSWLAIALSPALISCSLKEVDVLDPEPQKAPVAISGCMSAADCPAPTTRCASASCTDGACALVDAPKGTFVQKDVPADCKDEVCDGHGGVMPVTDPSNVPTSTEPCVINGCTADGALTVTAATSGVSCSSDDGGVRCDGAGHCVTCIVSADCASGQVCDADHRCVAPGCADRQVDGNETDIDCGGSCGECAVGKRCGVNADCTTDACDAASLQCVIDACSDHRRDGNESDVDCGGACPIGCAVGSPCSFDADCASAACDVVRAICDGSPCVDGTLDGDETDVDCGGETCPPCAVAARCITNTDCASGACDEDADVCGASACDDHKVDDGETDIDCGGSCAPCQLSQFCLVDADCASGACDAHQLICLASACDDHHQDAGETDVDCGGPCAPCALTQGCLLDADCQAFHWCDASKLVCVSNPCADHKRDGGESDVDCGGTVCAGCKKGLACTSGIDCAVGPCLQPAMVCQ